MLLICLWLYVFLFVYYSLRRLIYPFKVLNRLILKLLLLGFNNLILLSIYFFFRTWNIWDNSSLLISIPSSSCLWRFFFIEFRLYLLFIHDCSTWSISICMIVFTFICIMHIFQTFLASHYSRSFE